MSTIKEESDKAEITGTVTDPPKVEEKQPETETKAEEKADDTKEENKD